MSYYHIIITLPSLRYLETVATNFPIFYLHSYLRRYEGKILRFVFPIEPNPDRRIGY